MTVSVGGFFVGLVGGFMGAQHLTDRLRGHLFPKDGGYPSRELAKNYTDARLPTRLGEKAQVGALLGFDPGERGQTIDSYRLRPKNQDRIGSDHEYGNFPDALRRARHLMLANTANTFVVAQLAGGKFIVREVLAKHMESAPRYDVYSVSATDSATKAVVSPEAEYIAPELRTTR